MQFNKVHERIIEMSIPTYFQNFSYVTGARVIGTGLQAIFYLIFASLLDPEIYGEMTYFIAIAGAVSVFARFGLPFTISVYQAKKEYVFSKQANSLAFLTTTAGALFLIPFNIYAAILSLGLSYFIMTQYNLIGLKKYKKQFWLTVTKNILIVVLPLGLYFVFEIPGVLIGMAAGNFVASLDFFKSIKRDVQSFSGLKKNYKVLIHNFGVDASTYLPRIADKLVIVPLFGFISAGLYQFNIQFLFALEMFAIAFHSFLLSEEASGKSQKKVIFIFIPLSVILVLIGIIFAPIFVEQFFPKYFEGVLSLQIMIVSFIPLSISAVFNAKLQAKQSTKVGFSAPVRIGSLLILLAILGTPYGLVGLAIAVFLSIVIYTIFLSIIYFMKRN